MNREMQRIQDDYIDRLRRSMKGMPPEAADEVEQEIRNHIEDALSARGEDSVGALLDVLERMGPPEDYGSDLGLYLMVDRGYREWSVPHMVRSTAFWSLGTAAGAVAFASFGILFGLAALPLLAGILRLLPDGLYEPLTGLESSAGRSTSIAPGLLLIAIGLIAISVVAILVRWFVGEYVRMARPHMLGGSDADRTWTKRSSRRIKILAAIGLAATFGTWLGLYVAWVTGVGERIGLPRPPSLQSEILPEQIVALLVLGGIVVFLLSPFFGLAWTRAIDRRRAIPGPHPRFENESRKKLDPPQST